MLKADDLRGRSKRPARPGAAPRRPSPTVTVGHPTSGRRDFWLLWTTATASNLGDGIRITALPLLAVSITTDPLAVSGALAATFAPWLVLALVGGAAADRLDRKRLIVGGQAIRALAVGGFALLVASDRAGLAALYAVAVIIGTGEVVVDSALQAAVPRVAGDDLEWANGRLTSAQFLTNDMAGGPIGGLLFATSAALPFAVDAGTFAVGVTLMAAVSTPLRDPPDDGPSTGARPSLRADIAEGGRFLLGSRLLTGLAAAAAISNLADAAVRALVVLLVVDLLGASDVVFGIVMASGAVFGFVGSSLAPRVIAGVGRRAVLIGVFVVLGAGNGVVASAQAPWVVAAGTALTSVAIGAYIVTNQSLRQRLIPDRLLGRVLATSRLPAFGAVPLGSLGGGALARQIGVRPVLGLAAGVSLATSLLVARVTAGDELDVV